MSIEDLQLEFDLLDAKYMGLKRKELFFDGEIHDVIKLMTLREVIEYYETELSLYKHSPLVSKECVLLLIELLMLNIKMKHCEVL